mgnify:CR=1 FL=1
MKEILIKNVTILTMDDENSRFFGWILLKNGKIDALGEGEPPACSEVLDGEGGVLTPGLIDIHSHLGLYEDGLGFEGADGNDSYKPVTPELRAIDGINPFDNCFTEARAGGVTSVVTGPGSANVIGGQFVAMKTFGRSIEDMTIKFPAAMKAAFGENPKRVFSAQKTFYTRMSIASQLRGTLLDTLEYDRSIKDAKQKGEKPPKIDHSLEAMLPVVRGELPLKIHAHRADDIFTALRISKEFGLRPVIIHGTEAHLVADLIAEENVPVVCGPYMTDRSKPEIKNLTDEAPGILSKAGIPTAITVDHPEIPLRLLPVAVMLAVRAGMDKTDALRAVTAVPAKIAGLSDRIGSLRAGLDADCVLWSGDPLDIATQVKAVFVNGTPEYRRTR